MKYLVLSLLCLATSMNAGKDKKDKWERKAEKKAAKEAAAQVVINAAPSTTNGHDINCPGLANGGCWQCNSQALKEQGQADRK